MYSVNRNLSRLRFGWSRGSHRFRLSVCAGGVSPSPVNRTPLVHWNLMAVITTAADIQAEFTRHNPTSFSLLNQLILDLLRACPDTIVCLPYKSIFQTCEHGSMSVLGKCFNYKNSYLVSSFFYVVSSIKKLLFSPNTGMLNINFCRISEYILF